MNNTLTHDTIVSLASKAGVTNGTLIVELPSLERFAKLLTESAIKAERAACASLCDYAVAESTTTYEQCVSKHDMHYAMIAAGAIAQAKKLGEVIRSRDKSIS